MLETMFVRMPLALLLGAAAAWWLRPRLPGVLPPLLAVAAFVAASLVMPFWMLPLLMDRAAAFGGYAMLRDISLALTGFTTLLCFPCWAPLLRHLWAFEQVGMLLRYAVWYGLAPTALCTAWDASEQAWTGFGLLALALSVALTYAVAFGRAARRAGADASQRGEASPLARG